MRGRMVVSWSSGRQRDIFLSTTRLADTRDGQQGDVDYLQQARSGGPEQCPRDDAASRNADDEKIRTDAADDPADFSGRIASKDARVDGGS